LPRITSAITDTIQAAENSQTTTVPIHHHMVASPPFKNAINRFSFGVAKLVSRSTGAEQVLLLH
jgi:hypothetical protein